MVNGMINPPENAQLLAEAQIIRNEVSAGRIVYHAIKYGELPSADPRRDASLEAMCTLLIRILRPINIGGTILGLFGVEQKRDRSNTRTPRRTHAVFGTTESACG
jgi:hypothetical protein